MYGRQKSIEVGDAMLIVLILVSRVILIYLCCEITHLEQGYNGAVFLVAVSSR